MTWDLFSIIGTIAFALSGAIVAMEEEYDLFGVYILGLVTAFGGGAVRNTLIGYPAIAFWDQGFFFAIAIISITLIFFFTNHLVHVWKKWEIQLDAIGLAAFAIQGTLYAKQLQLPISAMIVAGVLTGIGGGIIRDVLAQRKPLVFREEVYALWTILASSLIGLGIFSSTLSHYFLFIIILVLRLLSVHQNWHLPRKSLQEHM
ncbi:MAG: trimeric intracellular cation channel family protein [Bacillaceae bacterium]